MRSSRPVILCSPPDSRAAPDVEYLGLYYVDAYLMEHGIDTVLMDGSGMETDAYADQICAHSPSVVGITLSTHYRAPQVRQLASAVKARSQPSVVVGGHLMMFRAVEFLRYAPDIDFAVVGEGEVAMYELVRTLSNGEDPSDLPGVVCRNSDRRIRTSGSRPPVENLDSLPFPSRPKRVPVFSVASSRGCPGKCGFCSVWRYAKELGGAPWRPRTADNVVAEVKSILARYPEARTVSFVDDMFLGYSAEGRARAVEIGERLAALQPSVPWAIACRPDEVVKSPLDHLTKQGLRCVHLGIESGSNRVLARFAKGTSAEANKRAISIVRSHGLSLKPYFMFFEPEMTLADVADNIDFLEATTLARPTLMRERVIPYPGTVLYERCKQLGVLKESEMVFQTRFVSYEVACLCDAFRETFKAGIAEEQEIALAEFEADIEAWRGNYGNLSEVNKRWEDLSVRTVRAAKWLMEGRSSPGSDPRQRVGEACSLLAGRSRGWSS